MQPHATALACLLGAVLAAGAGAAEPVDNCATVLGSLAVELRIARQLPPGRSTTFSCAKRYNSLLGASRERVRRALGTPDRTAEDGGWSYVFGSRHGELQPGTPELVFRFDGSGQVGAVDCHRSG